MLDRRALSSAPLCDLSLSLSLRPVMETAALISAYAFASAAAGPL